MAVPYKWPQNAKAAIALTLDNLGEAADLQRNLWPSTQPIGQHFSVTQTLPKILSLLKKYDIYITYFLEAWNFREYPTVIANSIAGAGHEVAWHGWQHEEWYGLGEEAERENFERSFGEEGLVGFITGSGKGRGKVLPFRGFRPPGGLIHGRRTLDLCRDHGLGYISPAAEHASIADTTRSGRPNSIVILPFRWRTVDAYYYMDSFAGLRKLKGEQDAPLSESVLVERYIAEIDKAIENEEFLSLLFHPFLTNSGPRLAAMEAVIKYLAEKRGEGLIWIARCRDIEHHVRRYPRSVKEDPEFDTSQWR